MKQNPTDPTNFPAGDRRPVLVALPTPRPTTVPAAFRAAARVLAANGLYQGGDYFPNALSDVRTPFASRPLSIVAALRCAVTGDPRAYSLLADEALMVLAFRLEVDGEGPQDHDLFGLEAHVDDWAETEGRTTESAVAVLYAAADASEQVAA
ncbi:hypothetical protein OG265_27045 [Streptomyces sp. NBC_01208]|uniref:DUF6197 family protein n=1 Tax=Streptomyces sp. NBC_01208 TaxID=2903773 RepID=UPI002E0F2803|nr:hypothetical protein OG265_27045 [Streptomyces sp. NBC_01208]